MTTLFVTSQHDVTMDEYKSKNEDTIAPILSDPSPAEFNKGRIREMFQIFQSQDKDDLAEELKIILKYAKAKVSYLFDWVGK